MLLRPDIHLDSLRARGLEHTIQHDVLGHIITAALFWTVPRVSAKLTCSERGKKKTLDTIFFRFGTTICKMMPPISGLCCFCRGGGGSAEPIMEEPTRQTH